MLNRHMQQFQHNITYHATLKQEFTGHGLLSHGALTTAFSFHGLNRSDILEVLVDQLHEEVGRVAVPEQQSLRNNCTNHTLHKQRSRVASTLEVVNSPVHGAKVDRAASSQQHQFREQMETLG